MWSSTWKIYCNHICCSSILNLYLVLHPWIGTGCGTNNMHQQYLTPTFHFSPTPRVCLFGHQIAAPSASRGCLVGFHKICLTQAPISCVGFWRPEARIIAWARGCLLGFHPNSPFLPRTSILDTGSRSFDSSWMRIFCVSKKNVGELCWPNVRPFSKFILTGGKLETPCA